MRSRSTVTGERESRATEGPGGNRLDQVVALLFAGVTRGQARAAIADGRVFVDGRRVRRNSFAVAPGALVRLAAPAPVYAADDPVVVYEDDAIAVVRKPAGMPVEPTRAGDAGTLVRYFNRLGTRIGVVHRLDRDVTGLLVVAKKPLALKRLNAALRERRVTRRYAARVEGLVARDEQTIDAPLMHRGALRDSRTRVRVVSRDETTTRVAIELETGRTHQIRRHLASIGHPVVGDTKYGAKTRATSPGLALACVELAFEHPLSGAPLSFRVDVDALDPEGTTNM